MAEHHQDQKDPQMDFLHLNIIYLPESSKYPKRDHPGLRMVILASCNYLK